MPFSCKCLWVLTSTCGHTTTTAAERQNTSNTLRFLLEPLHNQPLSPCTAWHPWAWVQQLNLHLFQSVINRLLCRAAFCARPLTRHSTCEAHHCGLICLYFTPGCCWDISHGMDAHSLHKAHFHGCQLWWLSNTCNRHSCECWFSFLLGKYQERNSWITWEEYTSFISSHQTVSWSSSATLHPTRSGWRSQSHPSPSASFPALGRTGCFLLKSF